MNRIIEEDMQALYQNGRVSWECFSGKTVFVTGAYGMIPSYMVFMLIYLNEHIFDEKVNIIALGRNREKIKQRFGKYMDKPYFCFVENDICSYLDIEQPIDFIIHGASPACSHYYDVMPVDVALPNVIGTNNILKLAKKKNAESILYISSGEIYGTLEIPEIFENNSGYMDPLDIRSCYGESKRMGETLCKCYQQQFGVNVKIVRPTHTYGPTVNIESDSRVFTEFILNVIQGKDIVIKSDGTAHRSFCYIGDAIEAYFKILLIGKPGEAYNVGNENGDVTIRELAEIMKRLSKKLLNRELEVTFGEDDKNRNVLCQKVHPNLNFNKIETLGWECRYSVEEGFARTIRAFLE